MVALRLFEHNERVCRAAVEMMEQYDNCIHPTGTGKSYITFKLINEHPGAGIFWLSLSEHIFKALTRTFLLYKRNKNV